ncbi:DNA polymerase III subunit alpha [Candidatus Cyrtobacter comes]|uniref:DNA polymerase III subunit alpha n=1 Tax=Candidatus Cyrtobacter comes TaxID=675776 RepID=A0ABU5L6V6_9RICK|nr:DNA polymerase III subunit alpha [Candidatus Cyrtobacter comes]MDZ5761862.1 DNA polymerase III subunit alpha [Candidatus Cyrtobacter comes]
MSFLNCKSFTHLRVYSDYSIGKSTIRIKELAITAHKNQMSALCISDRKNLCASMEFTLECIKLGIKPLIGCSVFVKCNSGKVLDIILIAKNYCGYQNLLKLVTDSFLSDSSENYIEFTNLSANSSGILAISGALNINLDKKDYCSSMLLLRNIFANDLFIEIVRDGSISKIQEDLLLNTAYEMDIPIVATNPMHFISKEDQEAYDALLCISNGAFLAQSEDRECSNKEHYFKNSSEMEDLFKDLPEAIENTELISIKCSIWPKKMNPLLPKFSQNEDEDISYQAKAALEKLIMHLPKLQQIEYVKRLEYELEVIKRMGFSGYFLIVSDFIKWSKVNGIPVGPGRGSGAGSLVAWALQIIDIDPIKFGLLFERFLNPERISMPDFDIDFCQERREEVIEYVRKKYGYDKVASIITFGKLQARAVLRDVGRVMQIPYGQVDKICKMVPNNPANPVTLKEAIDLDHNLKEMSRNDKLIEKLLSISLQLEGVNRHVSTHAAGIIIADRPLQEIVALYKDANSYLPVIQYSLKHAEIAGLMKFDFLGLRTLSVMDHAIKLIKNHKNIDVNIPDSYDDQKTYELLSSGNVEGVFQFEGAGMKEAIKKLKPDKIDDLIALTSLYRPGPMDNLPDYITRKHGASNVEYPHPLLEGILKDTYGIIIYQEQVMQIAQKVAGYSMGEADFLRRAMGKKSKKAMEEQKAIFIEKSLKNSITDDDAQKLFAFIEKFASYGFNKSHAAAYSVISYKTAYLKAHYAIEFLTASLNFELHDLDKISMFSNNAKFSGIKVEPPDINISMAKFSIVDGKIFYGLGAIKNVGMNAVEEICKERTLNGKFKDLDDFLDRCAYLINKRMMEGLIKSGSLDKLFNNRKALFQNIDLLVKKEDKIMQQQSLINEDSRLNIIHSAEEWGILEKSKNEFDFLGTYVAFHPFELYRKFFEYFNIVSASYINNLPSYTSLANFKVAGIVTSKKIKSSKRGKFAFLQLTDETGVLDLSIFDESLLYRTNDINNEGDHVLCTIAIKNDGQRRRMIIEKLEKLEEIVRASIRSCDIYISSNDAVEELIRFTSSKQDGITVKLQANLNDSIVVFDVPDLYISYENLLFLKSLKNITIVENYL